VEGSPLHNKPLPVEIRSAPLRLAEPVPSEVEGLGFGRDDD
jgi:hypothetical protein